MKELNRPKISPARVLIAMLLVACGVLCIVSVARDLDPVLTEATARTDWEECQRSGDHELCNRVIFDVLANSHDAAWLWDAQTWMLDQCEGGDADSCLYLSAIWRDDLRIARDRTSHLAPCGEEHTLDCALRARAEGRHKEECDKGNSWACIMVRSVPNKLQKNAPALCSDGFEQYCPEVDSPYEIVQENSANTMYGAYSTVEDDVLREACEADEADACFVLGLNLTRAIKPHREPIPVETLDDTLGRACALRHDRACVVYASRLLDRPVSKGAERFAPGELAKIESLLKPACDRMPEGANAKGHNADACWLITTWLGPLRPDVDALLKTGEARCKADVRTCNNFFASYANLTRGYPPLDRNFALSARVAARGCELGSNQACTQVAQSQLTMFGNADNLQHNRQFFDVFARSGAQLGSDLGDDAGTLWLLILASTRPSLGAETLKELEAKLCPKHAAACRKFKEMRKK